LGEKHRVRESAKTVRRLIALWAVLAAPACASSLESLEMFPCGQKDLLCPDGWTCLGYPDGNKCTRNCSSPRDSVCPDNTDCKPVALGDNGVVVCVPSGALTLGQSCTHGNDCVDGAVCMNTTSLGQICVPLCGPGAPCPSGTCAMLTGSMGACGK
jgi:hypothetical protein